MVKCMLFEYFRNKKAERYLPAVQAYCARILESEKVGADNSIKYSIKVDLDNHVQYSDRYHPSYTQAAVFRAVKGTEDSISEHMDQSFSAQIREYMNMKGLTETAVYKGASLDRRLFSKIMTDHQYMPSKDTAIAVALSLKLSPEEASDLLQRAGYSLSHSIKRDIVFEYFFNNHIYAVPEINIVLEKMGLKPLGR